jgi:MFS family permease
MVITTFGCRSQWYVIFSGAMLAGSGIGPLVGSIIAHFTGGLFWVYATAICTFIPFVAATWFAIPESLAPAQMQAARDKHQREVREHGGYKTGLWGKARAAVWSAVEPLGIFWPSKHSFGVPAKRLEHRSWALMLVGLAYFPDTLLSVCQPFFHHEAWHLRLSS